VTVVHLHNVTISTQLSGLSKPDILRTRVLGKSPLQTLKNLLPSSKLELSTTNGLHNMGLTRILTTHAHQNLSNVDTSSDTNGLSIRMPHTAGKPIGSSAGKHLIRTNDVEGMDTDANVVSVLADRVGQVLVHGNAARLQCLGGNLLLLVADQMGDEGEEIDWGMLGADVVNLDLGFRYTATVAGLDVGLVLLVAVTAERTATHFDYLFLLEGETVQRGNGNCEMLNADEEDDASRNTDNSWQL